MEIHAELAPRRRWLPSYFNRMFGMVWSGLTLSAVGDGFATVALGIWVLRATGSAWAMSEIMLVRALVGAVFGAVGGGLADRFNRRQLMILCDVARATIFLTIAWLMLTMNHVPLLAVSALLGLSTLFTSMFEPSTQASIIMMVGPDSVGRATSLLQFSGMTAGLIGPILGGLTLVAFGGPACMAIDAVSFLASAACILLAGAIPNPAQTAQRETTGKSSFVQTLQEGFRFLVSNRIVGAFVLVLGPTVLFFQTAISVLFPTLAVVTWKASGTVFGVLDSLFAGGFALGLLVLMKYGDALRRRGPLFGGGLLVAGLLISSSGLASSAYPVMPIFLLFGVIMSVANAGLRVVLQTQVPPEMQGRVFGVMQATFNAVGPLSLLLVGLGADRFGPGLAMVVAGIGFALVGAAAFAVREVRQLN